MKLKLALAATLLAGSAIAQPPEYGPASGTLAIQGGGSDAGTGIFETFINRAGGLGAKIVVVPTADVHDYARVKLNGKELEAHAWQPYRWEVTSTLKAGANDLEIQVNAAPSARAGAGGSGGRGRGAVQPPVSGLLGPVRLVAR